jgi:predicted short-subunit dehydrogenase-like oxidoreductase (DUF2520 family)
VTDAGGDGDLRHLTDAAEAQLEADDEHQEHDADLAQEIDGLGGRPLRARIPVMGPMRSPAAMKDTSDGA